MKAQKLPSICFDASIKEDEIVVGIFHVNTKQTKQLRFKCKNYSSFQGEFAALACALDYARKNKINKANFFTDNKAVSKCDQSKKLMAKFGFTDSELIWIPRELNKVADSMTRVDYLEFTNINYKSSGKIQDISRAIRSYPFNNKVRLLKKLANCEDEFNIIKILQGEDCTLKYNKKTKRFVSLVRTMFLNEEFKMLGTGTAKKFKTIMIQHGGKILSKNDIKSFLGERLGKL